MLQRAKCDEFEECCVKLCEACEGKGNATQTRVLFIWLWQRVNSQEEVRIGKSRVCRFAKRKRKKERRFRCGAGVPVSCED